jgi:hypothetical protein
MEADTYRRAIRSAARMGAPASRGHRRTQQPKVETVQ